MPQNLRGTELALLALLTAQALGQGVSVAVMENGRIAKTYASGEGVTVATQFQAASISKPVAALAALRLVEAGKLDLDADVNTKLKTWKVPGERKVTLRQLLTHSAGLTVHGFRGYAAGEPVPTLVQALDGVKPANSAPIRVDTPPGTIWRYSGGGYTVLQQLLMDAAGRPFGALMDDLVLKPIGMRSSTFGPPTRPATGYRANGQPVAGKFHTYPEQAAAGLWTTPADLARFALALREAYDGKSKLLSQAMARQMLSRQFDNWGLGPTVTGEGPSLRFGHGGANEGFRGQFVLYLQSGNGAVAMTNSDDARRAVEAIAEVGREQRWPEDFSAAEPAIAVTPFIHPVDPRNRGAEIAEIHPAFDLDHDAADFGGKKIPALWRSNGLVTGLMGILRFGPAIPALLCWSLDGQEFCPPFTGDNSGSARMTRMQSDAITVTYSPFPSVNVTQTFMAVNTRLLRSRAVVRSTAARRLRVRLLSGVIEQSETGQIKPEAWKAFFDKPLAEFARDGVRYQGRLSKEEVEVVPGRPAEVEFTLSFGREDERPFGELLAARRKKSEEFYAAVPHFDFRDRQVNLFHRLMWERVRALAQNPAGRIPFAYFMGTSAPWGIDGLWIWDTAFLSQVLHYADPDWATRIIEAVLYQQNAEGLVPHWSTPASRTEISQPPLLGWAALRLYRLHGGRAFLDRIYPRLAAAHRWFARARTRPDGLPFWKQPDESGMDNSPAFDDGTDAHVDLVAELLADAGVLAEIARVLELVDDEKAWRAQEQLWRERMARFWDADGQFYFPLKGEKRIPVYGIQGLFPLWDPHLEPARRLALLNRLTDPTEFWTPYPVPSVSLKSPQFMTPKWFANTYGSPETGRRAAERLEDYTSVYWRGPVWVFSNAILYEGLRRTGEYRTANELGARMVKMMFEAARYGGMLWENFDPRDGKPSRLLPKGQADEMAASIFFLKALYDSQVGVEPAQAPSPALLRLRYTAAPKADAANLRWGPWTMSQKVVGGVVEIAVDRRPRPDSTLEVENQTGAPLPVRMGNQVETVPAGRSVVFPGH